MKIGHTELFCDNVQETAEFYLEVLGFDLIHDSNNLVWVGLNGTELLLRPGSAMSHNNYQTTNTALVLYTDDLSSTKKELEDRGLEFKGIDGSSKCLTFTDPSGHWWQLVNPNDH